MRLVILLSQYNGKVKKMPPSVGDVLRVTCRFKDTMSGDIVNVYHLKIIGSPPTSDGECMDDVDGAMDNVYSTLAAELKSTADPYDIRYDIVEMVGGVEQLVRTLGTRTWTLTSPPGLSGDSLPHQDAAIVNLRTALPRVFGRKYLGPIGEENNLNGSIDGGFATALGNYAAQLLVMQAGTVADYIFGVLSLKAGSGAGFWAPFVGAVVNTLTGTQRRRRINRGS